MWGFFFYAVASAPIAIRRAPRSSDPLLMIPLAAFAIAARCATRIDSRVTASDSPSAVID